jgi:signal transduction histidine kinase
LGALIIDVFGQAIMSYSGTNFDTAHNIPHILKISSLFVIVSSLAISSIQYNRLLKQREKVILDQYQKLKETDKMKDEFINIAAHELRTPIQPILTTAGLLKSKMRNSENDELLDVTFRNAKRLQGLADNILDATKIESKLLRLNLEKVDLNDIILDVLNDHILEERSSNQQKVKIIYQPKSIIVKADRLRMTQVVSNLLGNALKNTQEGSISIIVKNKDDQVTVSVKDTGKGIDRELFPRLFSKFATKSPTGGAGLGLFISRSIIEAHDGKIWAENETSGNFQGAIFTFSLSLKDS